MDVLEQYLRIAGIEPDESRDRESIELGLPVRAIMMPIESIEPEVDLTTRIMRDYPQQ